MFEIRTVLCPVDFSPLGEREVELAAAICRQFGAKLVLHHNLDAVSVGLSMGWMWNQVHAGEKPTEAMAEERLERILATLPDGVEAEARLSNGPMPACLHYLQEQLQADLLVLASHGASTEEHESVCERLLEDARCPVVVVHEGDRGPFRWPTAPVDPVAVLVPLDWTAGSLAALHFAAELARRVPIALHLLHVTPSRSGEPPSADQAAERHRLVAAVPGDLRERSSIHLASGDPDEEIVAAASRLAVSWVVMGTHGRGFFGRFTHDTAKAMLRRAACPVWYVPAAWSAA